LVVLIRDCVKRKYSGTKSAPYHFVQHKSHINWHGIKPGPSKITGLRPTARAMARPLKTQLTLHYINFKVVPHREQTPSYYIPDAQLVLWTENITHSKPQFNSPSHTYQEYYRDNGNICNVHQFQTQKTSFISIKICYHYYIPLCRNCVAESCVWPVLTLPERPYS